MELEYLQNSFREILNNLSQHLKFDAGSECIENTPKRLSKMFTNELLIGYTQNPSSILSKTFLSDSGDMVIVKHIPFVSLCAHHWLPFMGEAYIGYLPKLEGTQYKIIGLSKIPRLVNCFARRFQVQEEMTNQIANALYQHLKPEGCIVVTEAKHLCSQIRGVQAQNSEMICSAIRGAFENPEIKNEFLQFIRG